MSKTSHIFAALHSPSCFRKLGILSAVRPMSEADPPAGTWPAQLAALYTDVDNYNSHTVAVKGRPASDTVLA